VTDITIGTIGKCSGSDVDPKSALRAKPDEYVGAQIMIDDGAQYAFVNVRAFADRVELEHTDRKGRRVISTLPVRLTRPKYTDGPAEIVRRTIR
jgi:hypothetical protein